MPVTIILITTTKQSKFQIEYFIFVWLKPYESIRAELISIISCTKQVYKLSTKHKSIYI